MENHDALIVNFGRCIFPYQNVLIELASFAKKVELAFSLIKSESEYCR